MPMAETAALAGAGWVVSPIVTRLLNEGFSYLDDKGLSCLGGISITDRLENLETTVLPQFQLVIEAVEKSEHKIKLKRWLKKLKDAMYEAEDVLDLYQYQLLEKKVHLLSHPMPKFYMKCVGNVKKGLLKIELRKSLNKLEKIVVEAKTFRELLGISFRNNITFDLSNGERSNVTTSLPPLQVFGRDKECDDLIDKYLLDTSEACQPETSTIRRSYSDVVAIVGIGGAGKTTLAQLVYNDQRVINHFEIKMWVCVSRKLDVTRHMREMIESATMSKCPRLESLEALQRTLRDLIKLKKVLLVLDDVWYDESVIEAERWKMLVDPLTIDGKRGSKILVTARTENMPEVLCPKNIMQLRDLEEDAFISLFMHHAFGGTKLDDQHLRGDLEEIGKKIVRKLHKSPLAAKAVGRQLSKRLKTDVWKATLERDNLSDTAQVLLWSYQHLDAPLQRCFSYFSLFPKGYRFEREKMVHLWMAEGFINTSDGCTRMEDIGNDYFFELLSRSFLQPVEGSTEYCNMHDLFHDLAERVSEEDYFRIENSRVKEIPLTIRRLYVSGAGVTEDNMSFNKLENLRTLIVRDPLKDGVIDQLIAAIMKFKKLRVLHLSFRRIKRLPKYIGDLKHLRYLYLFGSDTIQLPVSLGKLYNLQLLKCPYANLPRSLKNLVNLRYFEQTHVEPMGLPLRDIGRLISLQNLCQFDVKKEEGYEINQLKNLNELRGSLNISNLDNVKSKDEAIEANLKDKKHLESLSLEWKNHHGRDCGKMNLDMEVLEGLQPHSDLINLSIKGYTSPRYPNWLLRRGCIEKLRSFKLISCTLLEDLPPMNKLFLRCDELEIWDLPNLRTFPLLPQSLQSLVVDGCRSLIFVSEEELQKSNDKKKSLMNIVRSCRLSGKLEIMGDINHYIREELARDCLEVKRSMEFEKLDVAEDFMTLATALQSSEDLSMQMEVDHLWKAYCCCQEQRVEAIFGRREKSELILPSSLQSLQIGYCNITDGALSQCLGKLTFLKSLELYSIRTITTLPSEEILHHLMALTDLQIRHCHWLKSLGGLHALLSLKKLEISSCPCLELEIMMPSEGGGRGILPPSLQCLIIYECMSMRYIVAGDLPNLVTLRLDKCRSLASLSLSRLRALTRLVIINCPELSALKCSQGALGSLEKLAILNVPKLVVVSSLSEAVDLSLFKELEISNSATLTTMLLSSSSHFLAVLRSLYLSSSPEASFHEEAFNSLASLKNLRLHNCKVQSLPRSLKSLSSLKTLQLDSCPDISSWSSNLPESLEEVHLKNCPGISSLSGLPASLRVLNLKFCPISSLPVHLPHSLISLRIYCCGRILPPPYWPESLRHIQITGWISKEWCRKPNDRPKVARTTQRSIW
ncbi:disease resistance protein RGA2-like [Typha angustifolia]|uniref:disease resistance protein RGA2-like n=1 Tax=Typha angustifolia TaxID=59011 RepID=UPI003C2C1CCD